MKTVLWWMGEEWQVEAGRSFFWRLKAPDALPGPIMMPYRGSRWFRRSNCEETKRDGDRPSGGSHEHIHANAVAHIQVPHFKALKSTTLPVCYTVLVDFF